MNDHKKLHTLLQLIRTLRETPMSARRLAQRYHTTTRTIYRYFNTLKACGFMIEKEGHDHFIPDAEEDAFHAPFDQEEAGLLRDALQAVHPDHPLTGTVLRKLGTLSDMEQLADLIVAHNIKALSQAIQDQRQVRLINYHSMNGRSESDRLVEPTGFTTNFRYLYAYEPASGQVKQFKPERMEEVEVLDQAFDRTPQHQRNRPDVFGMAGTPEEKVSLRLGARAFHLLLEEYPEVRTVWQVKEAGAHHACPTSERRREAIIPVKGFEGIGRFVLGLPEEVEVLGPQGFVDHLEEKRKMGFGKRNSGGGVGV